MQPRPVARLVAAALLAVSAGAARAVDWGGYDILTIRLGMTATQVLVQLAAQGIAGAAVRLAPSGCIAAEADLCAQTVRARTRDGKLLIALTRPPDGPERLLVYRIAYTIVGRGPADAETLRADAIDRYGRPTSLSTTTWCPTLDITTGLCPPGQPRLHIEPAPRAAGLVRLMDDSMLQRTDSAPAK